tara:strand:+ start:275 stop:496 length:222 start_codon:yes stop_codon:yes gene_type:complete
MIFDHRSNKENLIIKFSFRERLRIFLKGHLLLNRYSAYKFNTHFLGFVAESSSKFGDTSEHGQFKEDSEIESK